MAMIGKILSRETEGYTMIITHAEIIKIYVPFIFF